MSTSDPSNNSPAATNAPADRSSAAKSPADRLLANHSFPCKSCGGKLEFSPGELAQSPTGQPVLKCPYCGVVNEIAVEETQILEQDYSAALAAIQAELRTRAAESETNDVIIVHCNSCGADVQFDTDVTSTTCRFCSSPLVAVKQSTKLIKPQAVLPFAVPAEQARSIFVTWLAGRWFAPSNLKKLAALDTGGTGKINGAYLPFWTYDSDVDTVYSGFRGEDYYETQMYTVMVNGRSQMRSRQVRRTRWYAAAGQVFNRFDDVLVNATTAVPVEHLKAVSNFDLPNLVPYRDEYLAGMSAQSYTITLDAGFQTAQAMMMTQVEVTVRQHIGGDRQRVTSMDPTFNDVTFKHILLPIWIAAYRYGGKSYRFIVNGRTGAASGDRPYSWIKITLASLFGIAVVAVIVIVIAQSQQ